MTTKEQWTQTAIRLPDSFLERLDKIAVHLSQPGMQVTRTEALRIVAFRGVGEIEAEMTHLAPEKKKR